MKTIPFIWKGFDFHARTDWDYTEEQVSENFAVIRMHVIAVGVSVKPIMGLYRYVEYGTRFVELSLN